MPELKDHEYAALFPLMTEAELDTLSDDIHENGQREEIVILGGKILDGRNRYRACLRCGATPKVKDYEGDDPLGFVISKNLHRRHLTESQRAMVAGRLANIEHGKALKNKGVPEASIDASGDVSDAQAADLLNVSEPSVERAKKVQRDGVPELSKAVDDGEVSVSAAAEVAKLPKAEQKKVVKQGPAAVKEKAKQQREKKKQSRSSTPLSGRTDPSANASDVQEGTEEHDEGDGEGEEAGAPEKSPEPVPEADLGEVFVADVETLCRDMDKIAARIKAMKATPYAFSIHLDSAASQVEAARKTLWQGRPAHPCPYCRANEQVKPDCRACHGTSRVKKSVYDAGVDAVGGGR